MVDGETNEEVLGKSPEGRKNRINVVWVRRRNWEKRFRKTEVEDVHRV